MQPLDASAQPNRTR